MGPTVASDLEWFRTHLPPAATERHYEYPATGDVSVSLRFGADVALQDLEGALLGAIVGEVSRRWRIALVIEHSISGASAKFKHRSSRTKITRDGTTIHVANTIWRRISMAPLVFESADSEMPGHQGIIQRVAERYKSARYNGVQMRLYYTRLARVPVKIKAGTKAKKKAEKPTGWEAAAAKVKGEK
jgi:hypothetical protein